MLKITNPADGSLIRELPEEADVAGCYRRARAAQPAWAAVPLQQRLSHVAKFNSLVKERVEELARTLTSEMGKPIQ